MEAGFGLRLICRIAFDEETALDPIQFGLPEPKLIPVTLPDTSENSPAAPEEPILPETETPPPDAQSPETRLEIEITPVPFVEIFNPESAAGEVLAESKWRTFGNWPVAATGFGAIAGVLFFGLRSLKNRARRVGA